MKKHLKLPKYVEYVTIIDLDDPQWTNTVKVGEKIIEHIEQALRESYAYDSTDCDFAIRHLSFDSVGLAGRVVFECDGDEHEATLLVSDLYGE